MLAFLLFLLWYAIAWAFALLDLVKGAAEAARAAVRWLDASRKATFEQGPPTNHIPIAPPSTKHIPIAPMRSEEELAQLKDMITRREQKEEHPAA